MEYIELHTEKDQSLKAFFLERMSQEEAWGSLPSILQHAATELYMAGPLHQRCAYDEKVTCHSVFKPLAALLNGPFIDGNATFHDIDGVWMHVLVDNKTGQAASFSHKGPLSLSPENYINTIKKSKPYLLAHKNIGFYRLDTPSYTVLNGRTQESVSIPKIDAYDHGYSGHWPDFPCWLTQTPDDYMMRHRDSSSAVHKSPSGRVEWSSKAVSDRFGYNHSFDPDDCAKIVQDMLRDTAEETEFYLRNRHSNLLSLTRFQTILSSARIPEHTILALVNEISASRKTTLQQLSQEIAAVEHHVLQGVAIYPAELDGKDAPIYTAYKEMFYPEEVRSFIIAGAGPVEQRNRKECIHQLYQMMFGDTIEEQLSNRHLFSPRMTPVIKEILGISKNPHQAQLVIKAIDRGDRIEQLIQSGQGLRGVYSKNEIRQGLRFYLQSRGNGDRRSVEFSPEETLDPRNMGGSVYGLRFDLKDCCALAKIPAAWISTADGETLITSEMLSHPYQHRLADGHLVSAEDIRFVATKTADFLANAGAKIAAAQTSNDKETIKQISREWSWLSRSGGDAIDRLLQFDKKMNIRASYDDLPRILHQFSEAVLFRAIQEFPNARRFDIMSLSDSELQLNIDELNRCATEHYNDNFSNDEPEWDDEEECYIENDPIPFEESYGKCTELSQSDVWDYVKNDTSDFRLVLEQNQDLHKNYSTLIQHMNEHSRHQISWTPFLSEPQNLSDDLSIVSINNRLELLSEGGQMGHCVFSYLGECAAGRSVILGLRKSDDLNHRIATVELIEEDDVFVVKQCYGPHNSRVDASIVTELEQWVMRLNEGEIPYQRISNSSSEYDDFYTDIVSDPLREGAKAHAIPYNTDAVYDAILAFERYTPQQNIQQFFEKAGGGLGFVFQESDLYTRGYLPMKNLALQYGLPAETVLKVKTALSIKWFDDPSFHRLLPTLQIKAQALEQTIADCVKAIPSPSGKSLSAEDLKSAQADYTARIFSLKLDALQSHLLEAGTVVDRETLEIKLRKTPVAQVFASLVAPSLSSSPAAQPAMARQEYRVAV